MMCMAEAAPEASEQRTLEHAVYSLCTQTGRNREFAACNLYLLARHPANRKLLGQVSLHLEP